MGSLLVTSVFQPGGWIPDPYLAKGKNSSPPFLLQGIDSRAKSIALMMERTGSSFFGGSAYWLIWNIPVSEKIPPGIPAGRCLSSLGGAVQGVGKALHRYKGPRSWIGGTYAYRFTVFTVDCLLNLRARAGKKDLLRALRGHILQRGILTGIA